MVPRELQRALWDTYRAGQERTLGPSPEYLRTAALLVRHVAEDESYPEEMITQECDLYLRWAEQLEGES